MTDIALCQQVNSQVILDWMTALNVAPGDTGGFKPGFDVASDRLLLSKARAITAAARAGKDLQCWWQQKTFAMGSWITHNFTDGSLVDHFGHELRLTYLWEAFMYVVTAVAPGMALKSSAATTRNLFGWHETTGQTWQTGSLIFASYLADPQVMTAANFGKIDVTGTNGTATVLMGVLGERVTP